MEVEPKAEIVELTHQQPKEKRKNGKTLFKLKKQMEFYFSNSNLEKDRFLGKSVNDSNDGYVNLDVFQTFRKICNLSNNIKDIVKAISNSDALEINRDNTKVRRKTPWDGNIGNSDDRTVYVERLPTYADYHFVKNVFQRFGPVAYISIPRFRNTKKSKGFAFVEFLHEESANKVIEAYKIDESVETTEEVKERHHKDNSPHRHCKKKNKHDTDKAAEKTPYKASHSSFHGKTNPSTSHKTEKCSKKRKKSNNDSEISMKKSKHSNFDFKPRALALQPKIKTKDATKPKTDLLASPVKKENSQKRISFADDRPENSKKIKLSTTLEQEEPKDIEIQKVEKLETELTKTDEESHIEPKDEELETKDEKSKRKRKKSVNEKLKLRVISKNEWHSYRNKYLTLQRTTMSRIKKMLLLQSSKTHKDKSYDEELFPDLRNEGISEEKSHVKTRPEIVFKPGLITKIKLSETTKPAAEIKKEIRSIVEVEYIDATEGNENVFLRFADSDKTLLAVEQKKLEQFGHVTLLTGAEELEYWEKLRRDREARFLRGRPKIRGKDKIVAKATKMIQQNTHIHFDT